MTDEAAATANTSKDQTGGKADATQPDKAAPTPTPTPTPKPKATKVKDAEEDWQDATQTNEAGQQVEGDGFPTAKVARAMALAAAGKTTDKAEIVTDEEIAAYDPKAAEADREAIAQHQADKAEAAQKAAEKADAEAQKGE